MSTLIESLNWRYAAKQMNGNKVPQEKLDFILEAIRLAPTSLGLQALKVLVIENPEIKEKLLPVCANQPQITQSSHLLVFAVNTKNYNDLKNEYLNRIAEERNVSLESLEGFDKTMDYFLGLHFDMEKINWAEKQAYLAMGIGLAAAAEMKVDATPMEGFNPEEVDKILGLDKKDLHSCLIMPLGYRNADKDFLASAKKIRKSKENFFEFI